MLETLVIVIVLGTVIGYISGEIIRYRKERVTFGITDTEGEIQQSISFSCHKDNFNEENIRKLFKDYRNERYKTS